MPYRPNGQYDRAGPPPNMSRYPYKPPMSRGSEFDKPDRPGYFAGNNRPFRMDKIRHEALERDERATGHSGRDFRDQRNRPS